MLKHNSASTNLSSYDRKMSASCNWRWQKTSPPTYEKTISCLPSHMIHFEIHLYIPFQALSRRMSSPSCSSFFRGVAPFYLYQFSKKNRVTLSGMKIRPRPSWGIAIAEICPIMYGFKKKTPPLTGGVKSLWDIQTSQGFLHPTGVY